jgi:hypothetical protein
MDRLASQLIGCTLPGEETGQAVNVAAVYLGLFLEPTIGGLLTQKLGGVDDSS